MRLMLVSHHLMLNVLATGIIDLLVCVYYDGGGVEMM